MSVIYNSLMNVQAVRAAQDELRVETTWLATDIEAVGWLVSDLPGLIIKECAYAIYRHNDGPVGIYPVPGLAGTEAYFEAGAMLKQTLGEAGQDIGRELIAECVRGAIQAETFFFTERGYTDEKAYDAYWDQMYANACRYYSNLDKRDRLYMDFVGYSDRVYNLFNRSKQITMAETETGHSVNASFLDSFHELALQISLGKDGLVTGASGNFLRAPGQVCWENNRHLEKFTGKCLKEMGKRDIAELAGGSEGCNHLVDLLFEAAKATRSQQSRVTK